MKSLLLPNWNLKIGANEKLCFILGLNVIEDEGLTIETAQELKRITAGTNSSFIFKASFDKANRSSIKSFRGPGIDEGLRILRKVRETVGVPVITDIHDVSQAVTVAESVDVVQVPAFLCRQTDLIVAASQAVERTGGLLHIKKGQFLAPLDCKNILSKVAEAAPSRPIAMLCERGVSFGYNNLIVDILGIPEVRRLGAPVTIDATHAVQLPGTAKGEGGENSVTGGRRDGVKLIAAAGIIAGCDGVFLEFHPNPDAAKCDSASCLPLKTAGDLLRKLLAFREVVSPR